MNTDLNYLESMTEGNKGLIKELIGIFSTQVEEYSGQMQKFLVDQNWGELSKLAHKAKSTVAIMGMKDLSEILKQLEVLAKEGKKVDSYSEMIDHFCSECKIAVAELKLYK